MEEFKESNEIERLENEYNIAKREVQKVMYLNHTEEDPDIKLQYEARIKELRNVMFNAKSRIALAKRYMEGEIDDRHQVNKRK